MRIRIGTRGSALALWQAGHVRAEIERLEPAAQVELVIIKTQGDKILGTPLAKIGGKGLFVKEIEEALLAEQVDVAVHSMKDLPAALAPGLCIAAVPRREDTRDALLSRNGKGLGELASGARVGTSSLRRACQLRAKRPDLKIEMLRGNVDTRLRRLDEGAFDAIVLAAAGLIRLGHAARITCALSHEVSLPAVGQGALAIEVREHDAEIRTLIGRIADAEATFATRAERALLARLEGGCQTPIAAFAQVRGKELTLEGLVGRADGSEILREKIVGPAEQAESLGRTLAEQLLLQGADRILADMRSLDPGVVGGS